MQARTHSDARGQDGPQAGVLLLGSPANNAHRSEQHRNGRNDAGNLFYSLDTKFLKRKTQLGIDAMEFSRPIPQSGTLDLRDPKPTDQAATLPAPNVPNKGTP